MKTVILAGGLGTRISEKTDKIPKPMIEIGGKPILWHILSIYGSFGFNEFILALGYKLEVVKEYFINFYALNNNLTLDLKNGTTQIHDGNCPDWRVHLVDTGLHTQTGGRLKRLKKWIGNEPFMMTYGDGVSNINISELIAFHKSNKKLATVSAVRPPARFGGLLFDGHSVVEFTEKAQAGEGWINGGFFVLEPEVLDYIENDETVFEKHILERLAREGQLVSFKHEGFWQPMDTLREYKILETLWESGKAPWKLWK
jgi:glucose-1-phosphate cytidylyltransferase